MPFDTALSGIRAASNDLSVTGNNIANASTTGFKSSRAEFADVYATSVLGAGNNAIGSGVQVLDIGQKFTQGNVAFTEKELDLAVNGNGFFVISQGGETKYTRAGAFGLDSDGFVVNTTGARLQGFSADANGNLDGIPSDIEIQTADLNPRRTTLVESLLNLDAADSVVYSAGRELTTAGVDIGVARAGLQTATTTTLNGNTVPVAGVTNDFTATPMDFDITLVGQGTNIGTVSISLDAAAGVPPSINSFNDVRILASAINAQIFSSTPPIDVSAQAVDMGGNTFAIEFSALEEGLNSSISLSNLSANTAQIGLNAGLVSVAGVPQVDNGYPAQQLDFSGPDGVVSYTTTAGATAVETASELNALQGVTATAQTMATLSAFNSNAGNLRVNINGIDLSAATLAGLETEINNLGNSALPGMSAALDSTGSTLLLTSAGGDDIDVTITSLDDGDSLAVQGTSAAAAQTLEVDTGGGVAAGNYDAATNAVVVGGEVTLVLEDGYDLSVPTPGGLLQPNFDSDYVDVVLNDFDPALQSTYNSATSMTIYDSLGISHVMTQYFVKQDYNAADPTSEPNHWQMHVLIDGADVGEPDPTLPAPQNTEPTRATFDIYFNDDGSFDDLRTPTMLISNWVPLDADGQPSAADGPQNVLAGGGLPIPDPPTSSNFMLDLTGTTQFGALFSVNDIDQNGYATGRLSGLSVDGSGVIFARYTNGESLVLGQVVLASFANEEGLQPAGNSTWVENFESGQPLIAAANTGSLGVIQAGALEDSNVDLSAELVNLIIAQRNFQASAKTIETANAVTQTIINLR